MEDLATERDAYVDRIRAELYKLVKLSDLSQREIERLNNWQPRYLNQVLIGNQQLAMRHVCGVLAALEIPLDRFFAHLEGRL